MSIYSDYKVGAISDEELRNFGVRENRRDRCERECLENGIEMYPDNDGGLWFFGKNGEERVLE